MKSRLANRKIVATANVKKLRHWCNNAVCIYIRIRKIGVWLSWSQLKKIPVSHFRLPAFRIYLQRKKGAQFEPGGRQQLGRVAPEDCRL